MPAGRPSSYEPEYAEQAQKLAALGATDIEVADFFDVDVRTVYRWKHDYPEFCQALNVGKDKADERVLNSLYQKAVGYEQDAVKIFMPANAEAPVYADYREKIAPDTTAAIFWLKNRRPAEWRDKQEIEHGVTNDVSAMLERIATHGQPLVKPHDGDDNS
jgi:hypothetical protein